MYLQDIHFPEPEKETAVHTTTLQVLSQTATVAECRQLEITFHDGRVLHFQGAPALGKLLHPHVLMLEVDGNLVVYPWSSIRSVEITPAPQLNPLHVVQGLTRIDSV